MPNGMRQTHYELAEALGWKCGICGADMSETPELISEDHVNSRNRGGGNYENLIAAHQDCNNAKGDRPPTGCEVICLEATNAYLGIDLSYIK